MKDFEDSEAGPQMTPAEVLDGRRDRKFRIAMAAFAFLAVVIWFTVGEGKMLVFNRPVEIRWIPILVIATFAFRTYMAREADKIRRRGEDEAGML
jgi:hypothetical protein